MPERTGQYATDQLGLMVAVVDDAARSAQAESELLAEGFDAVSVYRRTGAFGFATPEAPDVIRHLTWLEQLGCTGRASLAEYETAARKGASVVSLRVAAGDGRQRALSILERAGARAMNYFGPTEDDRAH